MNELVRIKAIAGPASPCGTIQNYEDDYLLLDPEPLDEPLEGAYYEVAAAVMKSLGVKPTITGDLLPNQDSVLLCSERLANALAPHIGPHEICQVSVRFGDEERPYFIVRPLDRFSVIDLEASGVEPNEWDEVPGRISDLRIDPTGLPDSVKLFVPEYRSGEYLCERSLAERLVTEFEGVLVKELDDPTS